MPTDVRALFERETREVLTEPYGKPPGFLVLRTRRVTARAGLGYALVSGLTMGGLNLFGFSWAKYQYVVDVQLEVRNLRRELVGTYRGQGQGKRIKIQGIFGGTHRTKRRGFVCGLGSCFRVAPAAD